MMPALAHHLPTWRAGSGPAATGTPPGSGSWLPARTASPSRSREPRAPVRSSCRWPMYRPFTTVASVSGDGMRQVLRLDITDSSWMMRGDSVWLRKHHHRDSWAPLVTDHGKLMHLFLVRESDLSAFAHLHPATT